MFRVLLMFWLVGLYCLNTVAGVCHERPNIVVLLSDDAGYADFGFQTHASQDFRQLTPRIDSIASNGVRFSNAYMSASVCSPSRAGLMTGRYQQRFGHDNNIPPGYMDGGLPLTETFVAKLLQERGYRTGLIGKWHLGYPDSYHPNQRGFDFFYGCLQGSRKYFPIENPSPHRVFLENDQPTAETGYLTDRIGDGACRFITENKQQPFFLFVSFTAPHGPLEGKAEVLEKLQHIEKLRRKKNAALIVSLDENVGKILDCLQEHQLTDNTLVVFSNDNGGQTQYAANNGPLRGAKGTLWEGGIRVPLAMQWPNRLAAGVQIDDPVISLDWLPTFFAAANLQVPEAANWDGIDLLPRLTGQATELTERTLFWRRRGPGNEIAARRGQWKMVHFRSEPTSKKANQNVTQSPMLFNLSSDLGEQTDVAKNHPDLLTELVESLTDWEAQLKTPLWGNNPRRAGNLNSK